VKSALHRFHGLSQAVLEGFIRRSAGIKYLFKKNL
jgi:hypothetical protein